MQIKFCGAARNVTGSNHLVTLIDGTKILLDCGMFQGGEEEEQEDVNFERNKTISEFTSKKINFNEFLETFKDQSIKYHTNVILKDKLVYIKNENEE